MANISVSDYAAGADAVAVSGAFMKITSITITSRASLNSSFSSTVTAGTPIQGNMRQLAFDRWNYMYPS